QTDNGRESWDVSVVLRMQVFFFDRGGTHRDLHSFPTRRSSDLSARGRWRRPAGGCSRERRCARLPSARAAAGSPGGCRACARERSEEHTSELQSRFDLVCRLLLEKKNNPMQSVPYDIVSLLVAC